MLHGGLVAQRTTSAGCSFLYRFKYRRPIRTSESQGIDTYEAWMKKARSVKGIRFIEWGNTVLKLSCFPIQIICRIQMCCSMKEGTYLGISSFQLELTRRIRERIAISDRVWFDLQIRFHEIKGHHYWFLEKGLPIFDKFNAVSRIQAHTWPK